MSFDIKKMAEVGKREVSLFLGRMQPVHKGHVSIIKKMRNPIVAVVKGAKTSQDKVKNPLDADQQIKMLKKVVPGVEIVVVPNGYLPEIIDLQRRAGNEVVNVYAGADRIKGYQAQITKANKDLDDDRKMDVKFHETERVTSASIVRDAVRKGDEKAFQANMPRELWGEWETLTKVLKESNDTRAVLSFSNNLHEDVNMSNGIADNPKPLSPAARRKALEENGSLDVPNLESTKGKMRHGLPQIKDWDAFVEAVKEKGGEIKDVECDTDKLTPTQKNFNSDKVLDIIEKEDMGLPVVVSTDGYVVDGHHRWLAAHHANVKIKCRQVSLPLDEILELCADATFAEKKKINESLEYGELNETHYTAFKGSSARHTKKTFTVVSAAPFREDSNRKVSVDTKDLRTLILTTFDNEATPKVGDTVIVGNTMTTMLLSVVKVTKSVNAKNPSDTLEETIPGQRGRLVSVKRSSQIPPMVRKARAGVNKD